MHVSFQIPNHPVSLSSGNPLFLSPLPTLSPFFFSACPAPPRRLCVARVALPPHPFSALSRSHLALHLPSVSSSLAPSEFLIKILSLASFSSLGFYDADSLNSSSLNLQFDGDDEGSWVSCPIKFPSGTYTDSMLPLQATCGITANKAPS